MNRMVELWSRRVDFLRVVGNGLAHHGILDGMTLVYELDVEPEPGRLIVVRDEKALLSVVAFEGVAVLETTVGTPTAVVVGVVCGAVSYIDL